MMEVDLAKGGMPLRREHPSAPAQADGASFYSKAAQGLPAGPAAKQLGDWTKVPLQDLPQAQVQAAVQQAKGNLDLIDQGARCKSCNWPPFVPGRMPANLSEYRQLDRSALPQGPRLRSLQGQYDKAVETIRTGLAMSKHIGEAPTIIQGMTGIAMATRDASADGGLGPDQGQPEPPSGVCTPCRVRWSNIEVAYRLGA